MNITGLDGNLGFLPPQASPSLTQVESSDPTVSRKRAKHVRDARPLIQGISEKTESVVSYALRGKEREVAAFIKLGQETRSVQEIQQRRVPPSPATVQLRNLIQLCNENSPITFGLDKNTKKYIARGGDGEIHCLDLQELILDADWSQVVSDNSQKQTQNTSVHSWLKWVLSPILGGNETKLTDEDRTAIQDYVRDGYVEMNWFLRGELSRIIMPNMSIGCVDESAQQLIIDTKIRTILNKIVKLIQALRKLPDFNSGSRYLWRGERFDDGASEIQRRILAVGKEPISSRGFISTAASRLGLHYSLGNCITLLRYKGGGKDLRSAFNDYEQEVLVPPSKIRWLYHKKVGEKDFFIARTVA